MKDDDRHTEEITMVVPLTLESKDKISYLKNRWAGSSYRRIASKAIALGLPLLEEQLKEEGKI